MKLDPMQMRHTHRLPDTGITSRHPGMCRDPDRQAEWR